MEHHVGFEITPAGRAYLDALRPRGGCASWVRVKPAKFERQAATPLPSA